jgi:hypothetical protein
LLFAMGANNYMLNRSQVKDDFVSSVAGWRVAAVTSRAVVTTANQANLDAATTLDAPSRIHNLKPRRSTGNES